VQSGLKRELQKRELRVPFSIFLFFSYSLSFGEGPGVRFLLLS
jgi:hypothetical protein